MKKPRKRRIESQAKAAERLSISLGIDVSRDQIRRWEMKGYALDDPAQLTHQLLNSERPPPGLTRPAPTGTRKPSEPTATSSQTPSEPLTPEQLDARLVALESELLIAEDYETARTIRVQISGCRELFRIQTERGNYILRSSAANDASMAAVASKAAWEGLEDDLPPRLEGMTASQMKKELRDYARVKCLELSELFGTFS